MCEKFEYAIISYIVNRTLVILENEDLCTPITDEFGRMPEFGWTTFFYFDYILRELWRVLREKKDDSFRELYGLSLVFFVCLFLFIQ